MIKVSALGIGSKFRCAHPEQRSKNDLAMPPDSTFTIEKIFSMSPHMRICSTEGDHRKYSLLPDTPVILPKEPTPFLEEVEKFILGSGLRRTVVGYRMLYDGQGAEFLRQKLSRHAVTLVEDLYVTGIKFFTKEKIKEILDRRKILPKYTDHHILQTYRNQIHASGFMEVVYEVSPSAAAEIREIVGV